MNLAGGLRGALRICAELKERLQCRLKEELSTEAEAKAPPKSDAEESAALVGEEQARLLVTFFCVLTQVLRAKNRARAAAPHCGSHCRPRSATPPVLIAVSRSLLI